MKEITILPGPLRGTIQAPPSKSQAHRALICAALAAGVSRLSHMEASDDILATAAGLRALGAAVSPGPEEWVVHGAENPTAAGGSSGQVQVECGESGSTLRFLLPLFPACGRAARFTGRGRLGRRPLEPYRDIMRAQGIHWQEEKGEGLSLRLSGRLRPGVFSLPGDVSSQFVSGLCFALPLLAGESVLHLTTELESAPYLDLTLAALRGAGVVIRSEGPRSYRIPGGQTYQPRDLRIEGDYSQAVFFLVAGALGSGVTVAGLDPASRQGDRAALAILARLGYRVTEQAGAVTCAPGPPPAAAVEIDAAPCPDIIPALALAAALRPGLTTTIVRAGRLRLKECDRLRATATELGALGADIEEREDGLVIRGVSRLLGDLRLDSHGDHRMAMTLAIAARVATRPVALTDPDCVRKSYPGFWTDFAALGGRWTTEAGGEV
ncbi:MAG: 3-phosphoshikimate 1-carboxyvinyltransferase [Gracilibacteraceae bacterium]|jgi:3-phosphoshikimate 1-carboxyvinyltransferase|nr:3-phosphoshikimate 1-carboxyvinyltransferase [Gracilibacteraceae bacterium]